MAHTLSAKKRIRQNEKRNERNRNHKSRMKTVIKRFLTAVNEGDATKAEQLFTDTVKTINKTATKGVIHKRQAARRIGRLALKLNAVKSA